MKSRTRDLLNHPGQNGKGDADRTTDDAAYAKNLEGVKMSGVPVSEDPTFERRGGTYRKVYGQRDVQPDVKLTKPIIH